MDILSAATHDKESFKDLELKSEALKGYSFEDCLFTKCRFTEIDFSHAEFADCKFTHCELNLPKLTGCSLRGVVFEDCKLVGVDFTKCNFTFFEIAFQGCLMDVCNFSSLKLKRLPFLRCEIRDSRFIESVLPEANFEGSNLEGTIFHQTNLEKANFMNARNYSIDPMTNKLKGAIFSLPEAVSLLTGLGIKLK